MEITFEDPLYLLLLLCIPLLIISHYYILKHIKRKAMKFSNFEAMKRVTGSTLITKNTSQLVYKLILFTILIFCVSGPNIWYKGMTDRNDYVILIDSSASMTTEDVYPNRLEAAKSSAIDFIDNLDFRTEVGIVSFAGVPYVNNMITSDMTKVKTALNKIQVMPSGGTDIGSALVASTNLLLNAKNSKKIILMTDGSDTGGSFVEGFRTGLEYALDNHVIIYTIGIGTDEGIAEYIPLNISALYDKDMLNLIAERSGGNFYESTDKESLLLAFEDIRSHTKESYIKIELQFILLIIVLIMLVIEWGLANTRFRPIP